MLQFITVSDVTKHFVLNFTFQHVKETAGSQSTSSSSHGSLETKSNQLEEKKKEQTKQQGH